MEIQWSLVLFSAIASAGAWLFTAAMAQALLKKGEMPNLLECIVAAALLGIGGVASVTHLSHVERIFEALNRPTSGIFVEAALIGILIALIVVYCILLVRKSGKVPMTAVGTVTALIGILFGYMCGHSYLMEAREAWMTQALPISYCLSTAITGAGLNMLLKTVKKKGDAAIGFAGLLTLVLSVLALAACAWFFAYASAFFADAEEGAVAMTVLTLVTAGLGLLAGVIAWRKPTLGLSGACVAVVAGAVCSIAMRCGMWLVGSPLMDIFMIPIG